MRIAESGIEITNCQECEYLQIGERGLYFCTQTSEEVKTIKISESIPLDCPLDIV